METRPVGPQSLGQAPGPQVQGQGHKGDPGEFGRLLADYLRQVSELQAQADKAFADIVTGRSADLHGLVLALSEADLSFRLLVQIRNKLLDAYKEIMRMQF